MRTLLSMACLAAMSVSAGAQSPRLEHLRLQVGFGYGVYSFKNVFTRPKCEQLALPCAQPGDKVLSSVFGGGLWVTLDLHKRFGISVENGGFTHPWLRTAMIDSQPAKGDVVKISMVGPRVLFPFESNGSKGRAFVQLLAGSARSERLPSGSAMMLGVGVEGTPRSERPTPAVIGFDFGYRRVTGGASYASGVQTCLRVGIGFGGESRDGR